jgi:glutathione S-transferase
MNASDGRAVLFGSRLSPFVEKVVRALHLKGIAYRLVEPQAPWDFNRWNPQTGKMPVLDFAGAREYDSTFILRRLDQLVPDPPLYAEADPHAAAHQRFLEDWSDESLYWYGMALRWTEVNAASTAEQVAATLPVPSLARPLVARVLRWQIGSQARAQGLVRLPLERLLDELARRMDELLVWLGGNAFLFADRPGAADLAVFGQLRMLQSGPTPQGAELIALRPRLAAYAERVDTATRS